MLFTHSNRREVRMLLTLVLLVLIAWVTFIAYRLHVARTLAVATIAQTVPFQLDDAARKETMLVLGDSTAYGVGAKYPQESTAGRVSSALGINVDNVSSSGAKVSGLRDQLLRAPGNKYQFALVQIGANDVMYFASLKESAETLDIFLTSLSSRASRIMFLTSGDIGKAPIWLFPLNYIYTMRTRAWRELLMPILAKHNVLFVDLYTLPDPFLTDVRKYYAPDGLHLSGDGYAVWAGYIVDALHEKVEPN